MIKNFSNPLDGDFRVTYGPDIIVEDDGVYAETRFEYKDVHNNAIRRDLILTREAFVECYKKWIEDVK